MITRVAIRFLQIAALLLGPVFEAAADPIDACPPEQGCTVAAGRYRLILPEPRPEGGRLGAIMFFHGWQGSAEETVANAGLVALASRLGVALIAPDGAGKTWSYPGSPGRHRDEFVFVAQVIDDVARRFPVDSARIMASGFSQGGSMVWYLACRMPERFRAFAPIAGAFWEPLPSSCAGPRPPLVHIHGTTDTTVPLAGRALRNGYRQGDAFKSLAILDPTANTVTADQIRTVATGLSCRSLAPPGQPLLQLCLHEGGHVVDAAWIERAWRQMMTETPPPSDHLSVKR